MVHFGPSARPCNEHGEFLPRHTLPPERNNDHDWSPFPDCPSFELAELVFEKAEMSAGEVDHLLKIWAAHQIETDQDEQPPFRNNEDVLKTIDLIGLGDTPWSAFTVRYSGPLDDTSAAWKRQPYKVYCRDTLAVYRSMLSNTDFNGQFDYTPYREFVGPQKRQWKNLMSGDWAWRQAVSTDFTKLC